MFTYGISYAVASLSCTVGPFLAVTAAALRGGSILKGMAVYIAYAGGFTLVVGVLAIAAALASSSAVERMRRIVPYVNRISGALLLVVGIYVGYYGLFEIRLFAGSGNPEDPVIAAAGMVQGAIAGWVHQHGAWPWLVALVVLIIATVAAAWRASAAAKYRRADRATAGDEP
jgi:predicted PhzF superfamily epimerase YddE/YHI9